MTEPLLVYRKGEGWVYETLRTLKSNDRQGVGLTLLYRKPAIGERYIFTKPNMDDDYDIDHVKGFLYGNFILCNEPYVGSRLTCVLIPDK